MPSTVELQTEVLAHQFNSQRFGSLIIRWLNEAQRKIVRETDAFISNARQTYALVSGTASYDLPSDFIREDYLSIDETGSFESIVLLPLDSFQSFDELNTSTRGKPTNYAIDFGSSSADREFYVYPNPNKAYTVNFNYWKFPAEITLSVDPVIPSDYHDLLVQYALYKCFEAEHDVSYAQYHKQQFTDGLAKLKGALQLDTQTRPRQVSGTWTGF